MQRIASFLRENALGISQIDSNAQFSYNQLNQRLAACQLRTNSCIIQGDMESAQRFSREGQNLIHKGMSQLSTNISSHNELEFSLLMDAFGIPKTFGNNTIQIRDFGAKFENLEILEHDSLDVSSDKLTNFLQGFFTVIKSHNASEQEALLKLDRFMGS